MRKSIGGFTIVELIVVIVVIAILMSIAIVSHNWMRRDAYDGKVAATLAQLEKAFRLYVTKGNAIPLRHYAYNNFYAAPGGGWVDHGVRVYGGGGIGREMANRGYLPHDLVESLKGGPGKDLSLKGGIKFVTCGRKKVFFAIESFEGISQGNFNNKLRSLNCDHKDYVDWAAEHGIRLSAGASGSGTYINQPNYKIAEIDLE
ncbi:MAG: prepilin-type N-terminal cleavage/methylation domain-containing protein [Candidatus Saccharibacteria bacterium]|nr:prepilin-type N-terminal cleavage/methylation domain-containing protein [Candidatus Saccharibacteria bacterium]